MCTVTWTRTADGYVLFSNRDERDSRRPAFGPHENEVRGVRYVAPIDGDHGGSWIGVNVFGLSLCLLNRYGDIQIETDKEYISRGLLLLDLLDCQLTDSIEERLNGVDLSRYRPFTLLVIAVDSPALLFQWDRWRFSIDGDAEQRVPLTSSSAKEPGIAAERSRQFEIITNGLPADHKILDQFHRSHLPERGAYSVCMHREGARTVSLSRVTVSNDEIEFRHEAGSPCESPATEIVKLSRC